MLAKHVGSGTPGLCCRPCESRGMNQTGKRAGRGGGGVHAEVCSKGRRRHVPPLARIGDFPVMWIRYQVALPTASKAPGPPGESEGDGLEGRGPRHVSLCPS